VATAKTKYLWPLLRFTKSDHQRKRKVEGKDCKFKIWWMKFVIMKNIWKLCRENAEKYVTKVLQLEK
jgi:hypothetical protein